MNSLKIPDGGVLLAASESKPCIPQAFHVRLDSALVESIIHASQNGDDLRLALGKTPTLQYGSRSFRIAPPTDSADFDLYLTKPFESTREAVRIASTSSLFSRPQQAKRPALSATENGADPKAKSSFSHKGSASSGLDSDLDVVNGSAAAPRSIARDRARVGGGGGGGGGSNGSKLLDAKRTSAPQSRPPKPISDYGSKASSLPASPGLNPVPSPSLTPTLSASQQAMERAREQRFTLVHELAVQDCSLDSLRGKWIGKDGEFRPTLEKVAEHNSSADKWTLRKMYFKELDPWKYAYHSKEERQKAIDNAVRQFDKQRLSAQEPEWQKLLPKEERNKGKCLSRLQANLAKGPAQSSPAIKNGKGEDGAASGDGLESDRPKAAGERETMSTSASASASNPAPSKPKRVSAQDAQAKRLLTASSKAKPGAPNKTSPRKSKTVVAKANGRPALSKEIVENSDSSEGEDPIVAKPPLAKAKPATKKTTKDTAAVSAASAASAAPRRPPAKTSAAPMPAKRPLEDDDSSSSSGMPLSKRNKQKPHPAASSAAVHRASDTATVSSRSTAGPPSSKPKNTSPTKSSPLASSPPTNASDLGNEEPRPAATAAATAAAAAPAKKRKLEAEGKAPMATKKRSTDVSSEILNKASKFKQFYQQYEALHYEILALDNPPDEKLANLLDLRGRLETMKKEIYKDCSH